MNAERVEVELTEEEYEDVLNEVYGTVTICGVEFDSGHAFKELDPIYFNCSKNDYEDSLSQDQGHYKCGECGKEFDDEQGAEDCCKPEEE